MSSYIALSYLDVVLASIFVLLNGLLSYALKIGLEKRLLISALRMVIQLSIVGLLLKSLFSILSPWLTMAVALIMVAFAGREVWSRQDRNLKGIWGYSIGVGAMGFAGIMITIIVLTTIIGSEPWWSPRYALPMLGMILGNTMTGVSLALDTLHTTLHRERRAIEARLLLGATKLEALRPFIKQALRSGFTPILNSMAATGVVSIPGMMTGQVLSGVDPTEATKYQLMITFSIAGATGLGVLMATYFSAYRLTDKRDRLRLERLNDAKTN